MPDPAELTLQYLRQTNAILENDHFVYIAGDHGSGWIDKDALFPHTEMVSKLCRLLAHKVKDVPIDIVCGPATGGLTVAQWTAHELGVPAVFAEHGDTPSKGMRGKIVLRRGYDRWVANRQVLVVDDVIGTGHTIRETIEAIREAGGSVALVGCLVDRGNTDADGMGTNRYDYLLRYDIPSWPADQCPLCAQGVPVNTQYAHGQEFVQRISPSR